MSAVMYALLRPSKDRPRDLIALRSSNENPHTTNRSIESNPLPNRKVNKRKLLREFAICIGLATFMILWGALNVWNGKAFYFWAGSEKDFYGRTTGDMRIEAGFVTREEAPFQFWMVVAFKVSVGTLSLLTCLYILSNAYWKRWRRRARSKQLGE